MDYLNYNTVVFRKLNDSHVDRNKSECLVRQNHSVLTAKDARISRVESFRVTI